MHGAQAVARQALAFSQRALDAALAFVDGAVGIAVTPHGHLSTVLTFSVVRGKIVEIRIVADPATLRRLDVSRRRG